jgi:DNA-binding Lrp family transcriptional regulator
MRILQENPDLTQRELAEILGMSVGGLNYCLNALIDKGFVKMGNFQKSKNKFKYVYSQCSVGIVALDPRHKSHNIPGKFLTYMQSGLPVLANVNAGNDLAQMIWGEQVGQVCESNQVNELVQFANKLLEQIESDGQLPSRCRNLFEREFAGEKTVRQIVAALSA